LFALLVYTNKYYPDESITIAFVMKCNPDHTLFQIIVCFQSDMHKIKISQAFNMITITDQDKTTLVYTSLLLGLIQKHGKYLQ